MVRVLCSRLTRGRAWLREGGQSLVEFCLVMPLFMILVFGVIDFGMGLRAYITAAQAAREGARYAAVGNPAGTFTSGGSGDCNGSTTTTTVGKVCATLNGLDLKKVSNVSVTYPSGDSPGNSVHVSVTYNYQYITPIRRLVNFFSAGTLGSTVSVSSSVDMRLE
jgi:Flp pilus assembly protein TadG